MVQETLDRCTEENVTQLHQALDQIYQQHSQGFRHTYLRGGGLETALKGDKGRLGLTTRNKKRFEAQRMLVSLGSLPIVWFGHADGWPSHRVGVAASCAWFAMCFISVVFCALDPLESRGASGSCAHLFLANIPEPFIHCRYFDTAGKPK